MDFELSQDQRDLQDGIRSLVAGAVPLDATRSKEGADDVIDPDAWHALGDAGVFSLLVDEDAGGTGLDLIEGAIVFEELGRVLAPGPLVATTAVAPFLEAAAHGSPHAFVEQSTSAIPTLLEHPRSAATVVSLPAIESDALALVLDRAALATEPVPSPLDPLTPLAVVTGSFDAACPLEGVSAARLRQTAMVLSSAFQVGIAAQSVDLATEYAKHREQFGRPIGSFQAIKHLLADALVRTEVARASVHSAAITLDDEVVAEAEALVVGLDPEQLRWRAVAGAKMLADEAAMTNSRTAVQVYGGMGFTWEVPVHLFVKRSRVLAATLGTRSQLADLIANLI